MESMPSRSGPSLEVPLLAAGAEATFVSLVHVGTGSAPSPVAALAFGLLLGAVLLLQERRAAASQQERPGIRAR